MQKDFIDFIKNRVSITDIVSRKVKLSRSGKDLFGLCPFHTEKTASFKIDPESGYYYCFGCGAHGDVITFVMETEKLSFSEALENLANMYGIQLPKKENKINEYEKVYAALEAIKNLFISQLHSKIGVDAQTYLASRKISDTSIKKFQLGFAHEKSYIVPELRNMGFSEDTLLKTGVFFRSKHDNHLMNRFFGRIMLPIFNSSGKCIGFGGRTIGKSNTAKYINSPESDVFIKNQHLYGYNIAKYSKSRQIIIVEGYIDVIAMHQAGFDGAVASLGTSISTTQINMCWKISDNPIIALDGDEAGIKASYRWIDKILPSVIPGKSFHFLKFPQDTDPDSLIYNDHADIISKSIAKSSPLVDWMWDGALQLYPFITPEQKAAVVKMLIEKTNLIQDTSVRKLYKQYINQKIYNLYNKRNDKSLLKQNAVAVISAQEKIEKILVVIIINHPYIIDKIIENFTKINFKHATMRKIKERIIDAYSNYYIEGEHEQYLKAIKDLKKDSADILQDITLHATLAMKKTNETDIVNEWFKFFDTYVSNPEIAKDLQKAVSSLKSSFSNDDWKKLQALKKETLLTKNKRRGE